MKNIIIFGCLESGQNYIFFFINQKYKSLDYQFETKQKINDENDICLDHVPREQMSFTERS